MNSHAPLLSRDRYSDVVANAFMLHEILEAVNCYTRHPHHGGSSDQHQKRLESGFARFCHDHGLGVSVCLGARTHFGRNTPSKR
jgi:hypothetical protein